MEYGIAPNRMLPAAIMDFIFKDKTYGIGSPEFEKAIIKGDAKNIVDGIDSIILNAETKTKIKLSSHHKNIIHMIARDEIAHRCEELECENCCG